METAIYTRAEYMAFKTSDEMTANHRRYYAEIAAACNAGALIPPDLVAHCVMALKSGNDSAFNRLPHPYRLQWWDSGVHMLRGASKALRDRGDWLSLGTGVCILKEAARLKAEAVIAATETMLASATESKRYRLRNDVSIMFNGGGAAADGYPVKAKKGDPVRMLRDGMGQPSFALLTGEVAPEVASLYKHDGTYYHVWVAPENVEEIA